MRGGNPLSEARIHLHDLITSATSVALFVDWEDREETLELTQDLFPFDLNRAEVRGGRGSGSGTRRS